MTTGSWLLLITACQFHIPFYSSRMLPNVFALSVVLQSYACWVEGRIMPAASLLVSATAIFRCDLLLLLGSLGLSWLCLHQLTIPQALKIGIATGIVSLLITVPFDSLMWQRPLWPEGEVFYFNTILGKSKEWGTSPWHWYFSSALPKAMLFTLLLVPLSTFRVAELAVAMERSILSGGRHLLPPTAVASLVDTGILQYTTPVFGFVALYSFLGHKEMRFIFPALPILNIAAAVGMSKLLRLAMPENEKKNDDRKNPTAPPSWLARVGLLVGVLCIVLTSCGSMIYVAVSKSNYPGGDALRELSLYAQDLAESNSRIPSSLMTVHVHIDVAAAMSGVSLFGQRAAAEGRINNFQWKFSKDGYEVGRSVEGEEGYGAFTHLLSEDPAVGSSTFHVIRTIQGRPRLSLRDRGIVTEDAIFILERNGWRDSLNS
jgi:alpha-1,6-mannosyltransferase